MRFRFRLIPFIATLLLVALGLSLGQWQDRRALEKTARGELLAQRAGQAPLDIGMAALAPGDVEYRRVSATGTFVPEWAVYLDNRPQGKQAGLYVLIPLRLSGSDRHVLVARGWVPRNAAQRERIVEYATPAGEVTVTGIAVAEMPRVMELGTQPAIARGAILQNIKPDAFAAASGLAVQPFFVQQEGDAGDGLVRDWPAPSLGVEKHQGYAFQWYALTVMALLFFVITGFRSGKHKAKE
ncbi:MAG TPA: SURF1 family protein [Telluria sp.]|nr:SURF1 family protein [Telluria sp.]